MYNGVILRCTSIPSLSPSHMSFRLYAFLAVLFIFHQCQPSANEHLTPGYEYFPLETGRYIIYDVQELKYNFNVAPVQRTYQLKEVVGKLYSDVTGQPTYRLMRYRRPSEREQWQADSVWSVHIVNNEVIRTENGLDFVKLLFPVNSLLSWNGNQHNASEPDDYIMRNVGQSYYVLGKEFGETVTVVAQDDSTLTAQDKRLEVYARRIGLIYKERTQVQFCTATPACTGRSQIDYGIRQVYRIRTYGNE